MATLILVRHGRSTANTAHVLAGRTPGVHLDDLGRQQAVRVAERLGEVRPVRVVSSPLDRCRETAAPVLTASGVDLITEPDLAECDYGAWTGRSIKELTDEPLWRTVQRQPSAVRFPGGESLPEMSARAVRAVRRHDAEVTHDAGPDAVWVAFSHGDLIKSILADALGMHLDLFQRLHVDPGSASVIRFDDQRPSVLATNSHSGSLAWTVAAAPKEAKGGDAVVGGGAGPATG